jgi:hypothetical protein
MGRARFGNDEPVASHLALLTRVFDISEGPVLELGTGFFSTLLLHWLATTYQRQVFSFESSQGWYDRAKKYENRWHHIVHVPDWDAAQIEQPWGMAFVDHSPGKRRPREVVRLAPWAQYIVIHDTQDFSDGEYQFSKAWPSFQYRHDYKKVVPWTSVVSNFHDLAGVA